MNNAGHLEASGCSSSSTTTRCRSRRRSGAMSTYLSRLYAGEPFQDLDAPRPRARSRLLPPPLQEGAQARARACVKGMSRSGGTLFEELGFSYVGPIDGHDMDQLLAVLRARQGARRRAGADPRRSPRRARATPRPRPPPTSTTASRKFDVVTGAQAKAPSNAPSYTKVFARALIREAEADDADRRGHRRHARRHRPQPVRRALPASAASTSASPSSTP